MELPYTTPTQVAQAYCVPWNSADPNEPLYDSIANQFDTDNDPSMAAIIKVALQNQIMLYRKSACTDCATQGLPPTQTVINPPSNSNIAPPSGAVQINTTDQEIAGAVGLTGSAAVDVASALKDTRAIPVIGIVTSVISDIVGIFGAAHAKAVAEEQATNCAVAFAFNKWIPQYDLAVAKGSMAAEDALAAVTQLINQQLIPALSPVIKGHNWGWGAGQVLQAHLAFRQQWYSALEQNSSVFSSLVAEGTSSPIILLAIAAAIVYIFSGRKSA